jgi:hypothetical protein
MVVLDFLYQRVLGVLDVFPESRAAQPGDDDREEDDADQDDDKVERDHQGDASGG